MSELRLRRVGQEIKKVISDLLEKGMKDPRLKDSLVTITHVLVTPDFKYAKVYVSVLDDAKAEDVLNGLNSAKGYIRKEVGSKVKLRFTPEFSFVLDKSMEYAMDMSRLIDKVRKEDEERS